ncbi:MAG: hypothetical protein K8I03_00215 [Ignavibacteria bacterium]|nr:hypothetical protein [Ignavibacteria bacterium]
MIVVNKPGKTKEYLLSSLGNLKSDFSKQIADDNISIAETSEGYSIKAEKTILFMKFWVDANVIAKEGRFEISWETNAPESKVEEALISIKEVLEKV